MPQFMYDPSHHTHTYQVYILTKIEGGRHTPFVNNYQPQLYTRTADVSVAMQLPDGKQLISDLNMSQS